MTFLSRLSSRAPRTVVWAQLVVSTSTLVAIVAVGWPALKADALARAAGRGEGAQPLQLTEQQKADFVRQYEALPKVSVPIDADGAKVLVVKFNDYQCPPCRQSFYDYKPIFAKYAASGRVKFVLKHFPLESECNAAIGGSMHQASCEAAAAVVMAQSKGTADKLEEWFFANQPSLTPDSVKQAAASVAGISNYDAQYARALTLVRTDAGLGALLGAKSTPTFVVNGHVIAGAMPAVLFELAIEHELAKKD